MHRFPVLYHAIQPTLCFSLLAFDVLWPVNAEDSGLILRHSYVHPEAVLGFGQIEIMLFFAGFVICASCAVIGYFVRHPRGRVLFMVGACGILLFLLPALGWAMSDEPCDAFGSGWALAVTQGESDIADAYLSALEGVYPFDEDAMVILTASAMASKDAQKACTISRRFLREKKSLTELQNEIAAVIAAGAARCSEESFDRFPELGTWDPRELVRRSNKRFRALRSESVLIPSGILDDIQKHLDNATAKPENSFDATSKLKDADQLKNRIPAEQVDLTSSDEVQDKPSPPARSQFETIPEQADFLVRLGYDHATGSGDVALDFFRARELYAKAIELNDHPIANLNLGLLHLSGAGSRTGRPDTTGALRYFDAAADRGNARALYETGYVRHFGSSFYRDYDAAFEAFRQSYDAGYRKLSAHMLGVHYESGLPTGMGPSRELAIPYYARAAQKDVHVAQYRYGRLLLEGREEQRLHAFHWVHEAAKNGVADAAALLAEMYRSGRGIYVGMDMDERLLKAREWQAKADELRQR